MAEDDPDGSLIMLWQVMGSSETDEPQPNQSTSTHHSSCEWHLASNAPNGTWHRMLQRSRCTSPAMQRIQVLLSAVARHCSSFRVLHGRRLYAYNP